VHRTLAVTRQRGQWNDTGVRLARGNINKTIYKGSEPKSRVSLQFTGDYQWRTGNNITADALMELMRIKLREKLREEKGGTYGVSCSMTKNRIPSGEYNILISFGCAPENVESLMADALNEIDLFKQNGVSADDLNNVKELMKRQCKTDLLENWHWASKMMETYI
jgi:zinc protease